MFPQRTDDAHSGVTIADLGEHEQHPWHKETYGVGPSATSQQQQVRAQGSQLHRRCAECASVEVVREQLLSRAHTTGPVYGAPVSISGRHALR